MELHWKDSYGRPTHSKCIKGSLEIKLFLLFQVGHKTKKCVELNTAVKTGARSTAGGTGPKDRVCVCRRLADEIYIELQTWPLWSTTYQGPAWGGAVSAEENNFFAYRIPLCTEMFYEIMFMRIITSVPIVFMIHYLIHRSVVTAVIHKYPFFITFPS